MMSLGDIGLRKQPLDHANVEGATLLFCVGKMRSYAGDTAACLWAVCMLVNAKGLVTQE